MKNPVHCKLVGIDGNAYSIMGAWQRAAKRAGWTNEEINEVLNDAMSDDYDHLLQVILSNTEEVL